MRLEIFSRDISESILFHIASIIYTNDLVRMHHGILQGSGAHCSAVVDIATPVAAMEGWHTQLGGV